MLFSLLFLERKHFLWNVFAGHTKASTFHVLFRCIRRACRAFFRRPHHRWAHHLFEVPTTWHTRIHRVRNQFASVSAEVVSAASIPCTDTRKDFSQPAGYSRKAKGSKVWWILRYCKQRNRVIEWTLRHWSTFQEFCSISCSNKRNSFIFATLHWFEIHI